MKTLTSKQLIMLLLVLSISCSSNSQNYSSYTNGNQAAQSSTTNMQINPQVMKQNLDLYYNWNSFVYTFFNNNLQNAQYIISSTQQMMYSQQQMDRSLGMPYNTQLYQQYEASIQSAQQLYQQASYVLMLCNEQSKLLQSCYNQGTAAQGLFTQATGLNAVLLYYIFCPSGVVVGFDQALTPAVNWYFSSRCNSDIQNGVAYLKSLNKINASYNYASMSSGSNIFADSKQMEKFSDVLLDRKTWIDTENGDMYKMHISIDNPQINGNYMEAY